MKPKYQRYRTKEVIGEIAFEEELKELNAHKERTGKLSANELAYKDAIESAGRLSYFTEVFEGTSLEEQQIQVEGYGDPKNSLLFKRGREIAERLVRNNIANMENYADFCKVETGIYRNGR